jgi:hypothetical protein
MLQISATFAGSYNVKKSITWGVSDLLGNPTVGPDTGDYAYAYHVLSHDKHGALVHGDNSPLPAIPVPIGGSKPVATGVKNPALNGSGVDFTRHLTLSSPNFFDQGTALSLIRRCRRQKLRT